MWDERNYYVNKIVAIIQLFKYFNIIFYLSVIVAKEFFMSSNCPNMAHKDF